jgi:hypothetical protein
VARGHAKSVSLGLGFGYGLHSSYPTSFLGLLCAQTSPAKSFVFCWIDCTSVVRGRQLQKVFSYHNVAIHGDNQWV